LADNQWARRRRVANRGQVGSGWAAACRGSPPQHCRPGSVRQETLVITSNTGRPRARHDCGRRGTWSTRATPRDRPRSCAVAPGRRYKDSLSDTGLSQRRQAQRVRRVLCEIEQTQLAAFSTSACRCKPDRL